MSSYKIILTAGFAMFSMFFGAGNLMFPVLSGSASLSNYSYATLGFIATGVLVPFLGLLGMINAGGDYNRYFRLLGDTSKVGISLILLTFLIALQGPFVCMPRCMALSFGGVSMMFPSFPLWGFSLFFCFLIVALIWRESKVVELIALVLTPFKLGGIILLILFGLWYGPEVLPTDVTPAQAFKIGFDDGYHPMDLVGAFFFTSSIYMFFKAKNPESDGQLFKWGMGASLIGAVLLGVIYVGFVLLGAKYAPFTKGIPTEQTLFAIAHQSLGSIAVPAATFVISVSCLATSTVVADLFARFLRVNLLENIFGVKIGHKTSIIVTVGIAFALSLLGFEAIRQIVGQILHYLYPALIVYATIRLIIRSKKEANAVS